MLELDEEVQLLVALYLKKHKLVPVRGGGTVRLEFQEPASQATRPPVFEPLLQAPELAAWYIRWPAGSLGWWTERQLTARGFTLPPTPLIAIVHADGRVEACWQPPADADA